MRVRIRNYLSPVTHSLGLMLRHFRVDSDRVLKDDISLYASIGIVWKGLLNGVGSDEYSPLVLHFQGVHLRYLCIHLLRQIV